MDTHLALRLVVLALIDATSIGTLVIPLWLVLRRGSVGMARTVRLYLCVITGFYFALGVLLLLGGHAVVRAYGDAVGGIVSSPAFRSLALVVGIVAIVYGFSGSKTAKEAKAAKQAEAARSAERIGVGGDPAGPIPAGPVPTDGAAPASASAGTASAADIVDHGEARGDLGEGRWAVRLDAAMRRPASLVGLALVAGMLEVPTMLPYLVATGSLVSSDLAMPAQLIALAAYCLVMVLPAVLLLAVRLALGARADAWFARLSRSLGRFASESFKWIAAIGGILAVRWAVSQPGLLGLGWLLGTE